MLEIEAFDEATVQELRERARNVLLTDAIVTEEQGRQQDALLNAAGVPHAYHVHPGGHALDPLTLTRLLAIG